MSVNDGGEIISNWDLMDVDTIINGMEKEAYRYDAGLDVHKWYGVTNYNKHSDVLAVAIHSM